MDTSMAHLDAMICEGFRTTFKAAYTQASHVKVTEYTREAERADNQWAMPKMRRCNGNHWACVVYSRVVGMDTGSGVY